MGESASVILASASPRRRELLALLVPAFRVETASVEEVSGDDLPRQDAALENARRKAEAVAARHPDDVVIGCDTIVVQGGSVLGKPQCEEEAADMLSALSGMWHNVRTGVVICSPNGRSVFVHGTTVYFSHIPSAEILRYIKTPEPYDKAGGYGIQGWAARYIRRIEGCYYNVMGLPVESLYRALRSLGYADLCL